MKAIETVYKGYRFRSRLEARWAVFFDTFGIEWTYEHEGYEVEIGDETFRYLPDFWFPKLGVHAEVKGDPSALSNDMERMHAVLDFSSPLPHFCSSYDNNRGGLILLGDIPEKMFGIVFHPLIMHHKGLVRTYCYFTNPERIHRPNSSASYWIWMLSEKKLEDDWDSFSQEFWDPRPIVIQSRRAFPKTLDAYDSARMARFEHGQLGAV